MDKNGLGIWGIPQIPKIPQIAVEIYIEFLRFRCLHTHADIELSKFWEMIGIHTENAKEG